MNLYTVLLPLSNSRASPYSLDKFGVIDASISQRTLEGETIDLVMKREYDHAAIRMLHFYMTSLSTYFNEPKP